MRGDVPSKIVHRQSTAKNKRMNKSSEANDYLIYNTSSGTLFYDADKNGTSAVVQFCHVEKQSKILGS